LPILALDRVRNLRSSVCHSSVGSVFRVARFLRDRFSFSSANETRRRLNTAVTRWKQRSTR